MTILRVKSGPTKGKVYDVQSAAIVIGRDVPDGIQVLDQGISRRHAEIFRIGEMFFIRDLESRNGTFVNDKQVSEEMLRLGDQIRIGNSVLVFEDQRSQLRDSNRLLSDEAPALAPAPDVASPGSTIVMPLTTTAAGRKSAPPKDESPEGRRLRILIELTSIIHQEMDISRLLSRAAELIGQSLDADHVSLLWQKPETEGAFEILGRYDKDVDAGAGSVSRGIVRDCLRFGRSILTSDASLDQQFSSMATVVMKQLRSVICVPIILLGSAHGVLYIHSKRQQAFNSEDLELASSVGIQLGTTIGLLKTVRSADAFFRNSIKLLVSAIETHDPTSRGRSERVAGYCLAIARELGLETHELRTAWLAGMLHGIGSLMLTDKERAQGLTVDIKVNHHLRELFKQAPAELRDVLPAIECRNERWDGTGSPEGKKAEAIPQLGRVLGVALELDRNLYHGSAGGGEELTIKDALLKLKETADRMFDRETLNALFRAYRNHKLFSPDQEFFELPLS